MGRLSSKVAHTSKLGGCRTHGAEARVLAIDYGRRRLGLAISDPLGWTAAPLAIIERKGRAADLAKLGQLVRQHGAGRVIVGYPLKLDGTPAEMAEEAARFARRVEQALALPVDLVDERLTSWDARQWQLEHKRKGATRGDDDVAAAILLQEYLGRPPESGR